MAIKIIKYGHKHCSACNVMDNILKNGNLSIPVINKDVEEDESAMEEAIRLGVRNMPGIFLFDDDEEITHWSGIVQLETILDTIRIYKSASI